MCNEYVQHLVQSSMYRFVSKLIFHWTQVLLSMVMAHNREVPYSMHTQQQHSAPAQ